MATNRIRWEDPNSAFRQEEEVRIYRDTAPFDAGSLPAVLATLATDVEIYDDTTAVDNTDYWYAVGFVKDGVEALAFISQVYVLGSVFSDGATFGSGIVNLSGNQSLIGSVFNDAASFGSGIVSLSGDQSLIGSVFNDAATFGSGFFDQPYTPVAEPTPSVAMEAEYLAADEYVHDWANLTGWTVANVQVSSNRLYSNGSGTNPSACYYPFAVASGESARLTCEIVRVTGANRTIYVGFETVGGVAASSPNFCGVGINGNDDFEAYIGVNFTGPDGAINLGNRSGSGTYTVTVSADPDYVSLVVRLADGSDEGRYVIPRANLPGGGAIAGITVWNNDTRGLSGSYIKGIGVRKSLTPFRTKTVTGSVIEGTSAQVINRGVSGDYWRIHLPKAMDGETAHPICLFTHQASTGDRNSVWRETRARPVLNALDNAGYIVISADDGGDRWGNQASIDNYLEAVQWVRDNFYAGPLVLWSPSMGGTTAWNIILRREAHVRAVAAICPVCDTEEMYRSPFVSALNAAYGVSDLSGLQAALAAGGGYNPIDGDMIEFTDKGVKFWVGTGTSDSIVPEALHAVVLQGLLSPYAAESTIVEIGSGHLATAQYDAAAIVALFDAYT